MEKLGQNPENERNVEQDRLAFIEAVKNTRIEKIETEFDENSVKDLISELDKVKLFLLGEIHGAKENADVIYTLFKKFGFRKLALEWSKKLQKQVDEFLKTGDLDFEAIKNSPDGRITAGHFALFKKLKEEGLLESVLCFIQERGSSDWDVNDANMAKNILPIISGDFTLVAAGNKHTETMPITFENDETEHHPMGENIKKLIPSVPSGRIEYQKGQHHNFGPKDFWINPDVPELSKARFYKSDEGVYLFELPEAHVAIVPNPSERE
jgi:hypothetical protein